MSERLPRSERSDESPRPEQPDGRTPSGPSDAPDRPDDDAFKRLRAADPAAGAAPDAERLAAALRTATGVDVAGALAEVAADAQAAGASGGAGAAQSASTPSSAASSSAAPTSGAPAGPARAAARRRWGPGGTPARWLQVAAVVAGLAVVGGGGYALGDRGAGGSTTGTVGTPLPAIGLGGPPRTGSGAAAPEVGSASGGASSSSQAVGGTAVWWGSRTVFSSSGLDTTGGTGTARAFDAASVVSADTARRAAKVLGVPGEPRAQWGTWTVGAQDGSGPTLTLSGDGTGTLSFSDPAWDPWRCVGDRTTAAPPVCTQGAAPAPQGDAAVSKVRALLHSLGVDLTGATVQVQADPKPVQDAAGAPLPVPGRETVTFSQVVDGQLTGVSWSATLAGAGVQSLWGPLAPLVELGRYDVVSPAAAVDRLNDPRFGSFGSGAVPMTTGATPGGVEPAVGSAAVPGATSAVGSAPAATATSGPASVPGATAAPAPAPSSTVPPVAPATPSPGSAIVWPVRHVTITSARLGLAVTTLPSGAAVLVPTYQLTDADGGTWSVIAVVDAQLDLTAAR